MPTLSRTEVQAEVRGFFLLKDTCKLPCFWGITPGQTTWEEAILILKRVASRSTEPQFVKNRIDIAAWVESPPETSAEDIVINTSAVKGTVRILITRGFPGASSLFLPQFLESNGPPEEMWMHSFKSFPDNHPAVRLFLLYPEKGILATFYGEGEVTGEAIRACWREAPILTLWEPGRRLTFEEAYNILRYPETEEDTEIEEPIGPYRRLEEATGVDIATFYNLNAGSAEEVCLETPQHWWLDPF